MTTTINPPRRKRPATRATATTRSGTSRSASARTTSARTASGRAASARTVSGSRNRARSIRKRPTSIVTAEGQRLGAMLTFLVLILTLFGLVMVLSASSVTSLYQFDASPYYQFQRQLIWAGLGAAAFIISSRVDYRLLQRLATPALGFSFLLLVLVLIPGIGRNINGSSRWLGVGSFVVQPAELAKFTLVLFCADLLSRRQHRMDRPELTIRPVLFVLGGLSFLLLMQPKLGTPLILALVAFIMMGIAGARMSHLFSWAMAGALAGMALIFMADYRRQRFLIFLNPWSDPLGAGLQTIQSQVGIASGGLLGVGLGASRAKWGFLPYAHSDFIFAIVAEEVGLIGAAAVVLAFVGIAYVGVRAALSAPDVFGQLLAIGITTWLMVQAFLNIGMAVGRLPITGEPLPFVSAGGSSLLSTLFAAGVLTSIARQSKA